MKLSTSQKKSFYKKLINLGVPLAIQQFLVSTINMLDTFMLGGISESVLTAAGLANKLFFVFSTLVYGTTTGAAIFIAQFFGKGDKNALKRYFGISLTISTIFGLIFSIIAIVFPYSVMSIFTKADDVIEHGVHYLRITGLAYIPTAISLCIYSGLKSTRHTYIPLVFAIIMLVSNGILNYIGIYVLDLGIEGAAYATLIVRLLEFSALIATLLFKKTAISSKNPKSYFSFSLSELKNYFRFAGFVIFVEFEWALGNALYSLAFRKYGTTYQAAVQVSEACIMLLNVFAIALGSAAAIIIGITIGEGKNDLAVKYAHKVYFLSLVFGAAIGVIVLSLSPVLPLLFPKLTDTGRYTTTLCLIIMAIAMPLRCAEFMLMVGTLRSGGDTRFCVMCDTVGVWTLTLPALLLSAYVFTLPFLITYALINLEMVFKTTVGTTRLFRSRKWLHNVTEV